MLGAAAAVGHVPVVLVVAVLNAVAVGSVLVAIAARVSAVLSAAVRGRIDGLTGVSRARAPVVADDSR